MILVKIENVTSILSNNSGIRLTKKSGIKVTRIDNIHKEKSGIDSLISLSEYTYLCIWSHMGIKITF